LYVAGYRPGNAVLGVERKIQGLWECACIIGSGFSFKASLYFRVLDLHLFLTNQQITMMFRTAILATLAASVAAKSFIPEADISADSRFGKRLMEKATRSLENDGGDSTWMVDYSIKYLGCSSLIQVNAGGEGGGDGDDGSFLYTANLVKFALCPSDESCSSCTTGSAQYVVNMMDFVDAYTEMKMEEKERQCEYVRESCYCDNGDDDYACESACYAAAGMDYCTEYEDDEEFEVQRYLECSGKSSSSFAQI
jgi:hypothetical protein